MATHASHNDARTATLRLLTGLTLWVPGVPGWAVGPTLFGPLPAWDVLLTGAEVLRGAAGPLSPFVSGVVLSRAE